MLAKEYLEKKSGPLTFGRVLKAQRLSNEMTQDQLAEKIGVSKAAVSQFESGKAIPKPETLKNLSKTFGLPIEMFLRYVIQDFTKHFGNFEIEIKKAG